MNKAYKIILSALLTIIVVMLSFNCQTPATESKENNNDPRTEISRWTGISHSNFSGKDYEIFIILYDNDTFSGETTGADFTINFSGGGNLSGPSFNVSGTGKITTESNGSDTFLINFTGTMSDTVMSGNWNVDYLTFPDDDYGTFYLTRSSSSSSSEPPVVSSSSTSSSSSSSNSSSISSSSNSISSSISSISSNSNSSSNSTDTTPPLLNNITVAPGILNGAGQVKVMIDAIDSGSEINYIYINFKSPLEYTYDIFTSEFTYNSSSGFWEATWEFKEYSVTGIWKINNILLTDSLNNSVYYSVNTNYSLNNYIYYNGSDNIDSGIPINNGSFELTGTNPDITAPVLNNITITPNVINASDGTVMIKLNITDDISGIERISLFYSSPSWLTGDTNGQKIQVYIFDYNSVSGLWEASCDFQSSYEQGIWKIDDLIIYDNAQNHILYKINTELDPTNYVLSINNSSSAEISIIPINSSSLTKN